MRRSWKRAASADLRRRARRRRGLVALLVPAFVASGLAAWTAPAAGATCGPPREDLPPLYVQGTFHETQYVEEYAGGGAPVISGRVERSWAQGKIKIVASTCKDAAGWRFVKGATVESQMLRLYLDADQKLRYDGRAGRGWAIISNDLNQRGLVVNSYVCDKIPFWGFLSEVAGLPWPGKWAASAAGWVISKVAARGPNTSCRHIGTFTATVKFTSTGAYSSVTGKSTKVITSSTVATGKKLVVERWTSVSKG